MQHHISARSVETPDARAALRHRMSDALIGRSIQALTAPLRRVPEPRHWYTDCAPQRVLYRPAEKLLRVIDGAIDEARREGFALPREAAHAPPAACAAYIDAWTKCSRR